MCVLQSLIHQIKGVKKFQKKEELVDNYLIHRLVFFKEKGVFVNIF